MNGDRERLQRLLGAPELAALRKRLRRRFERGETRDVFTLTDLREIERRSLEGLLGRTPRTRGGAMRLKQSELDTVLSRAGIASSLRTALELLDGPVRDLKAERLANERRWSALSEQETDTRLRALLSRPSGLALVKRCAGGGTDTAAQLLDHTRRVLARLPESGIPLARLAAETLGDAHALDLGQPVAALVLRALGAGPSITLIGNDDAALRPSVRVRDQWASVGVSLNELALPVLCLNLPVRAEAPGTEHGRISLSLGEPVHLTLRTLLRNPPSWDVADRVISVCENPSVVAIAADTLGARCAPLVSTDGMPSAAQRTLLGQLAIAGARLRYHGDFDWPGLRIGNFVMRELRASPWRFRSEDYLAAEAERGPRLVSSDLITADWDPQLAQCMASRGLAVHEEAVAEDLVADLA